MRICPSILNADHSNLPQEIAKVAANSDWLHLDIMDHIFVPNLTFTLDQSKEIIRQSVLPVDSHLMIIDPDDQAPLYAKAGSKSVTFHIEASHKPLETINRIKEFGARAAVALKPNTSLAEIFPIIEEIDMILIMTVEPGFGGQKFMKDMLVKVRQARTELERRHLSKIWIQVDGGISLDTISLAAEAGADTFVAGSAVFGADDPLGVCDQLRELAIQASAK